MNSSVSKNASVRMIKNFIRVEVDKWAILKKASTETATQDGSANGSLAKAIEITNVNSKKNISATEYEEVDPQAEDGGSSGGKKGRGKKGRGKKGKKGKGKKGKGKKRKE